MIIFQYLRRPLKQMVWDKGCAYFQEILKPLILPCTNSFTIMWNISLLIDCMDLWGTDVPLQISSVWHKLVPLLSTIIHRQMYLHGFSKSFRHFDSWNLSKFKNYLIESHLFLEKLSEKSHPIWRLFRLHI